MLQMLFVLSFNAFLVLGFGFVFFKWILLPYMLIFFSSLCISSSLVKYIYRNRRQVGIKKEKN